MFRFFEMLDVEVELLIFLHMRKYGNPGLLKGYVVRELPIFLYVLVLLLLRESPPFPDGLNFVQSEDS